MNWVKKKKILITKSAEECGTAFDRLIYDGAEIVFFPTIKIVPTYHNLDLTDLIISSHEYDYVIFTSSHTVEIFSKLVEEYNLNFSQVKVAAIGTATSERCIMHGIPVSIIPAEFSANGLLNKFSEIEIVDKKILLPGSTIAREELFIGLSELGASVTKLPIYDTQFIEREEAQKELDSILNNKPDLFVFTSPSSFFGFVKIIGEETIKDFLNSSVICSIGNTTKAAIRDYGFNVNIVPDTFSLRGIVESIRTFYLKTKFTV